METTCTTCFWVRIPCIKLVCFALLLLLLLLLPPPCCCCHTVMFLLAATFKFKYCWCHVAIILLLPCWCHSATSMMLMPYCCWYSAVAILLLSFCFCHAAAALFVILLFPYCCYWCHVVMCHVSLLHSKSERLAILISGYTIIEDGNTLRVGVSDPEVCSTNKQHGFHRYIWENTEFFSRLRRFCKACRPRLAVQRLTLRRRSIDKLAFLKLRVRCAWGVCGCVMCGSEWVYGWWW